MAGAVHKIGLRKTRLFVSLLLAGLCSGCAVRGFCVDRGRDAADIFTATVGYGYGAKARVGPVGTGWFINSDRAGLRGGHFFIGVSEFEAEPFELTTFFFHGSGGKDVWPMCSEDAFVMQDEGMPRPKSYTAGGMLPLLTSVPSGDYHWSAECHHSTQLEVATGLWGTVRLGLNLAELVDFAVGWAAIDPMGDDVSRQNELRPPPFDGIFVVPTENKDQYGNPVRRGSDPTTGWPYEIWTKGLGYVEVQTMEEYETWEQKGWFTKRKVKVTRTRPVTKKVPVEMEFVFVPAGEFTMGSPSSERDRDDDERQHRVRLTKPFYLAKYEVTQGQWRGLTGNRWRGDTGNSPWSGSEYVKEDPRNPVVHISWRDCQRFLNKLGSGFRLPTESEWEYACRAGSPSAYCFGDDPGGLKDYAWYDDNAWYIDEKYAHAVGTKRPNAWGLYDMHGNVREWCHDWYGDYPSGSVTDPTGPDSGSCRVYRGASFCRGARDCRSASRSIGGDRERYHNIGFRPFRSLPYSCAFAFGADGVRP